MEQKIPAGRFCSRPYVVASFGAAAVDWKYRDTARVWTAEAFALSDTWAFRSSADYLRHLDKRMCSAFENVDVLEERRLLPEYDNAGMLALQGLASWCVARVMTYPASNGRGVLVSGLGYSWEIWSITVGDIRGVLGLAVPMLVCPPAVFGEVRQYAGIWARATFGPAFLPFDLGGWNRCVEGGSVDRNGVGIGRRPFAAPWIRGPRLWNVWH